MKKIIIVGATSGIGRCLAEMYTEIDSRIGLIGRRGEKLNDIYQVNPDRYICKKCDILNTKASELCLNELANELGGIDIIIVCAGTGELNDSLDYKLEESTILTNILGWTCVIDWSFRYFQNQGHGHLINISSVGGLRGSGVAPAYNASKSYQINYMEGMRQKATKLKLPIHTTDIRPGFVDTAMAKGEGIFWKASLEKACRQIVVAIDREKKIAYITKRWRFIAFILKHLPAYIYCKM